jgi:hypothetical protein
MKDRVKIEPVDIREIDEESMAFDIEHHSTIESNDKAGETSSIISNYSNQNNQTT